jgi:hypothetical protein
LGIATLIFTLFAIGIAVPSMRGSAEGIALFSAPYEVLLFGSNAFGIRSKQGRLYASPFDATQPYGTAQMAGLKVLVRTSCVLAALIAIGASVWASSSLMDAWGEWQTNGVAVTSGLKYRRAQVAGFLGSQSAVQLVAMAVFASAGITAVVAWQAAREALKVRYPRRVLVAQWSPALWGLSIALLAIAGNADIIPDTVARTGIQSGMVIATVVFLAAPIYFLWSGLAERTLTPRYAGVALAVLAAFGAAYWTLLRAAGQPHAGIHWTAILLLSWPVLLALLGGAIAPWALHRVRHT